MTRNVPAERLRDQRYRQQVVKPKRGKGSFSRDNRVILSDDDECEDDECQEELATPRETPAK